MLLLPSRLLCSAARTEIRFKRRSVVFGTSVTEPRSPLDSTLYTLFTFRFSILMNEQITVHDYQYRHTHTRYNPTRTPNQHLHCAATARPLPPSLLQQPHHDKHREPINTRLSDPLKILTRNITHSSLSSPTSLAGPDRACLLRKDLLQLPRGWMFAVRGIEGGVVRFLLGLVRFACAFWVQQTVPT